MSGVVKINIVESAQTLKTLLAQQKTATGKERVQVLYLLKTGQIETVQNLAVCLGRDRVTVQRWLRQYRQGGLQKMLAILPFAMLPPRDYPSLNSSRKTPKRSQK